MSVSKTALTVTSVAVALLFGGGVYLMMNFGSIAKNVAERVASDTLGVKVSIGSIDVVFQEKSVTVNNVTVGNPQGYSGSHSAKIEKIYMKAQTLSQTLLNFNDVTVTGSEVNLEITERGTNLTDIKKTIDKKAAKGDKAAQQIKVIIEQMKIERMVVTPNFTFAGAPKLSPITIPDLALTGIGVKENGVLASEAIGQVWTHVIDKVTREANKAGYYQGLSPEALEGMGVTQVQQITDQISGEVEKIGEGIKGLFGNE